MNLKHPFEMEMYASLSHMRSIAVRFHTIAFQED